jgi:ribulose 1,5-bisphosphate carboxylase large subunit-like protein
MSQVLKLGRLSTKIKTTQMAICDDAEFIDYILEALRKRKSECQTELVPINAEKVRELLTRLDRAQEQGANEVSEVDNTWGFTTFYREWSRLMMVCDHFNRIHCMIRLLITAKQQNKSIWYILRLLGADYMLIRSISKEADKPLAEVYQPNPLNLSSREAEPCETDEDAELRALMAELGI